MTKHDTRVSCLIRLVVLYRRKCQRLNRGRVTDLYDLSTPRNHSISLLHPLRFLEDWCYYNNMSVIHRAQLGALIKPPLRCEIQMIFYSIINLPALSPSVGVQRVCIYVYLYIDIDVNIHFDGILYCIYIYTSGIFHLLKHYFL